MSRRYRGGPNTVCQTVKGFDDPLAETKINDQKRVKQMHGRQTDCPRTGAIALVCVSVSVNVRICGDSTSFATRTDSGRF
jgi:hypothetical protein